MSSPVVVSVSPSNGQTSVVLGTPLVITFDQVLNTASLNTSTFALSGPGTTSIADAASLIQQASGTYTGFEYVTGTFTFTTNASNQTVATFTPSVPLRPNVTYTVLIAGTNSALGNDVVSNPGGEAMTTNYTYSFTTGTLNLQAPPVSSPIPYTSFLDPATVKVIPILSSGDVALPSPYSNGDGGSIWIEAGAAVTYQPGVGYATTAYSDANVLTGVQLVFPQPVDPTSFSTSAVLVSLAPMLGDYGFAFPSSVTPSVAVSGNTITVSLSGWSS